MLYEILKTSKLGASFAPDMYTALWAQKLARDGEVKTLSGIPPLTFPSNGQPLLDYLISGNTVQNGTPTPDNPIMPNGTGDMSGNLFDGTLIGGLFVDANFNTGGAESVYKSIKVLLPAGTYTFSWGKNVNVVRLIIDGAYSQPAYINISSRTVTSTTDGYVGISFRDTTSSSTVWDITTPIMLNTGSTALPYEPPGYKIPILSNSTTTPVYLGEVESTRRIKKLVLTGEETWYTSGTYTGAVYAYHSQFPGIKPLTPIFCTHLVDAYESSYVQGTCKNDSNSLGMWVFDTATSPTTFKSYLAAQYAAGTPVTVWYILATPTTGIVNEPIRKIGDYADSLSMEQAGVEIPTARGTNTLDVLTDVKPSEVYIKYKS